MFYKAVPMQDVTKPVNFFFYFYLFFFFIVCRIFLSSLPLVTLLHFSHDQSNRSSPFFSNTTFQNFPGISDLLSKMSKFQHHTKLCSKCSTVLVYSLNLSPICWWKRLLFSESCFCHGNPGFNFLSSACCTVQVTCPPNLNSSNPSIASMVRCVV